MQSTQRSSLLRTCGPIVCACLCGTLALAFAALVFVGSSRAAVLGNRGETPSVASISLHPARAHKAAARRAICRIPTRHGESAAARKCKLTQAARRRKKARDPRSGKGGGTTPPKIPVPVLVEQEKLPATLPEKPVFPEVPPPVETPPVETPPVETPPVETPPVETPPVETPPVETPPVETPPVETPPVETPPVETPPVETPPVETPPVETPPVETPPVEKPPVETPPVEKPPVETPPGEASPHFRFFSSTSIWDAAVPAGAPLDPTSEAVVSALGRQIVKEGELKRGPYINTSSWSVPVYTVPPNQPVVKVTLEKSLRALTLQAAWTAVPLPANAKPAAGSDEHLVVWQPSTDRLWEFWHLQQVNGVWQAGWGGAIQNATSNSGAYGPTSWTGALAEWGASASSLSIAGGLITLEDLQSGHINHALAMAVPNPRAVVYASPAQRTDGWSLEPYSLPEGAHLRLDPNLDLAALHLPKMTLMMAEAAQRYGIVVRDTARDVTFYGQDPTPTGTEPYTGAHGYYEGKTPQQLLASFPWSHLQLLKMELH